ncbi:MAG: CDP-alcohol phosphatidyltransferase family protein [Melioribacteraceae bacterium]|nr:CDP-alcohol phosphatidyltransferase family protein [Melioribacteraceae bacterium]
MSMLTQYKSSLKVTEAEELVDLIFFRPLAFLFVKLIYKTSITPNQLTFFSMASGIIAAILISAALSEPVIFGTFFLILWAVLDCADGQLARLKKNGTPFGRLLDGIADYVSNLAIFIGIYFWGFSNLESQGLWLIVIIITIVTYAAQEVLVDYYRSEYISNYSGKSNFVENEVVEFQKEYDSIQNTSGQFFKKLTLSLYIRYSSMQNSNRKEKIKKVNISSDEYIKANKTMIRLWNLNGTSTHSFVLIFLTFFNRLDLYLWYILIFGNIWTVIVLILQKLINKRVLKTREPLPVKP